MQKKALLMSGLVVVLGAGAIAYVLMQKSETPDSQNSAIVQDENSDTSATVAEGNDSSEDTDSLKEGWKNYSSSKLGISFQYPEKVSNMVSGLDGEDGSVPVKVIEDDEAGVIYLVYGPSDTLESLKVETENPTFDDGTPIVNPKPSYGWKMITKKIQNDEEFNAHVKNIYGTGCFIDKKSQGSQAGVYEITLKGEDWDEADTDLGNTTCAAGNTAYSLLQATNSDMIVSINRGQEATFDDEEEILNSIRFY